MTILLLSVTSVSLVLTANALMRPSRRGPWPLWVPALVTGEFGSVAGSIRRRGGLAHGGGRAGFRSAWCSRDGLRHRERWGVAVVHGRALRARGGDPQRCRRGTGRGGDAAAAPLRLAPASDGADTAIGRRHQRSSLRAGPGPPGRCLSLAARRRRPAGDGAGPRWWMDRWLQGAPGTAADQPYDGIGLDGRGRDLSHQPSGHLSRSSRRRETRHRLGARGRRAARRRSLVRRRQRWVCRWSIGRPHSPRRRRPDPPGFGRQRRCAGLRRLLRGPRPAARRWATQVAVPRQPRPQAAPCRRPRVVAACVTRAHGESRTAFILAAPRFSRLGGAGLRLATACQRLACGRKWRRRVRRGAGGQPRFSITSHLSGEPMPPSGWESSWKGSMRAAGSLVRPEQTTTPSNSRLSVAV